MDIEELRDMLERATGIPWETDQLLVIHTAVSLALADSPPGAHVLMHVTKADDEITIYLGVPDPRLN